MAERHLAPGFTLTLVSGASQTNQTSGSEAGRAGAATGTAIGVSMIMVLWAGVALILGLFTVFTCGKKVIVEKRQR